MRIVMACPAPARSRKGNRVTAVRWAEMLRGMGHRLVIAKDYDGTPCDLLIALHARRSAPAIRAYRRASPRGSLIVVLTGTDLYHDIRVSKTAQRSLEQADRLVVLQPRGVDELPFPLRGKTHVVIQSAVPTVRPPAKKKDVFEVCVLGHLRQVKDPFRAALALRLLPKDSRIRVIQAGQALSEPMAARARALMERDPRYRWVGEISGTKARRLLARSRVLVVSSRLEGGANVISEALADHVPVLASHMSGNIGLLGEDYPGYFPVGDTPALARLLARMEREADYRDELQEWCDRLRPMVEPAREQAAWENLLRDMGL